MTPGSIVRVICGRRYRGHSSVCKKLYVKGTIAWVEWRLQLFPMRSLGSYFTGAVGTGCSGRQPVFNGLRTLAVHRDRYAVIRAPRATGTNRLDGGEALKSSTTTLWTVENPNDLFLSYNFLQTEE